MTLDGLVFPPHIHPPQPWCLAKSTALVSSNCFADPTEDRPDYCRLSQAPSTDQRTERGSLRVGRRPLRADLDRDNRSRGAGHRLRVKVDSFNLLSNAARRRR